MNRSLWLAVPLVAACAPVQPPAGPVPAPVDEALSAAPEPEPDLPPAGYGSLRQSEFSVQLSDMAMSVMVTPLAEEVIRLAAPDTYARLRALGASRSAEAAGMTEAAGAELFLVSFFSRDADVAYRPDDLQLTHRGRAQRAAGIIPLTTGWGRQLLQPEQTQSAIYVFEPPIDYDLSLTISYGLQHSEEWHRAILPLLEEERTRVASRSGGRDDP